MKITGAWKDAQQLVDGLETRTAVGKLDVRQDQPRTLFLGQRKRLGVGARNAEHAMAEALHQRFKLHRDERIVLDDQHVGGDFGRKLAPGLLDQCAQLHHIDAKHARCIRLGEALERDQQECLARKGGDVGELLLPWQRPLGSAGRTVDGNRIPDFRE